MVRDELAKVIIEVLHQKLDVSQGLLLAAIRDRAAVNTTGCFKSSFRFVFFYRFNIYLNYPFENKIIIFCLFFFRLFKLLVTRKPVFICNDIF